MALLMLESFDYLALSDINERWTQTYPNGTIQLTRSISSSNGRNGNGYRIAVANGLTASGPVGSQAIILPASGTTFICGLAFRGTSFSSLGTSLIHSRVSGDSGVLISVAFQGQCQCWLRLNNDGTLSMIRAGGTDGYGAGTILGTSSRAFQTGVFSYIEWKVTLATGATGSYSLKMDGDEILTGSTVQTAFNATQWREFLLFAPYTTISENFNWDADDLYVADGTTSGDNNINDFLGDIRIDAAFPTSDGANTAWSPQGAGSHYVEVDDNPSDDDTTYIDSTSVGNKDTYGFPNLAATGDTIKAVSILIHGKKVSSGLSGIKAIMRMSGTDYLSAEQFQSGSYSYREFFFVKQPSDSNAWTESNYNAAEKGVQKSS